MKHKRTKAIITLSLFIMAIVLSIVPSYAYNYSTLQVSVIDVSTSVSYTRIIPITQNITSAYVIYDPNTSTINIQLGVHDQTETYFITYMPSTYVCVINGYEVKNMTGYYNHNLDIDLNATNATLTVGLEMTDTNYGAIYTQEQYDNYGLYMQRQMESYIQSNPNAYGLYSAEQRQAYGNEQFLVGKRVGLSDASVDAQAAYDQGLQDGVKKAETAKDLLNVGLSGIYNAFLTFTQQSGIFGVSLLAILTSGVIIFIIYIIIKAVRG